VEKLSPQRLAEALTGWKFPRMSNQEEWLAKWDIEKESIPEATQFSFKENIYYKGAKVLTSTYSPYDNDRRIRIWDESKWSLLQTSIYRSHEDYVSRRLGK